MNVTTYVEKAVGKRVEYEEACGLVDPIVFAFQERRESLHVLCAGTAINDEPSVASACAVCDVCAVCACVRALCVRVSGGYFCVLGVATEVVGVKREAAKQTACAQFW